MAKREITMAAIKAYTGVSQSKTLSKILPLESADMKWFFWMEESDASKSPSFGYNKTVAETYKDTDAVYLPCWSLASLLEILDYPQLSKDKLGSGKEGWMVSVYPNNCRYDSCWHDNPIDACVDIIIHLHESNLL